MIISDTNSFSYTLLKNFSIVFASLKTGITTEREGVFMLLFD